MGACASKMEEEQPNQTNRSETDSSTPTTNESEGATVPEPVEVQEEIVIEKKVRQKRAVFAPGAFPVNCPEGYARDHNGRCRKIE